MLVLFETPAGHALFKLLDDAVVRDATQTDLESESTIKSLLKLKAFNRFTDTTAAFDAATAIVEGKSTKHLRKFLRNTVAEGEQIAVADAKLGAAIKDKTGLQCLFSQGVVDLMRGIRSNLDALLQGEEAAAAEKTRSAMVLGLAHSLSRYKLKFSPDKVDTMIVQAINLLDELDKEINIYAMRLREWYGWHFPEMGKIITENAAYAKAVQKMGVRTAAADCDFTDIVSEQVDEELKQAAQISMGTEISEEDVINIRALCDQVISLTQYRSTLYEYLKNRMTAIAPNLTAMVGELVGARLIAHAGSLLSLAKYPASTVQILGAEKALFRALKTKHATPKYGLIYHASVVGQAAPKHKGKISRSLAAKCALAIRVDALGEAGDDSTIGEQGRQAIEARLYQLEGKTEFAVSKLASAKKQNAYRPGDAAGKVKSGIGDAVMVDDDETPGEHVNDVKMSGPEEEADVEEAPDSLEDQRKSDKKKKKKHRRSSENGDAADAHADEADEEKSAKKKKKDKRSKSSEKKEKKRKRTSDVVDDPESSEKKKKKKKKRSVES